MKLLLLARLGGFIGSATRYATGIALLRATVVGFPFATLTVNISGFATLLNVTLSVVLCLLAIWVGSTARLR